MPLCLAAIFCNAHRHEFLQVELSYCSAMPEVHVNMGMPRTASAAMGATHIAQEYAGMRCFHGTHVPCMRRFPNGCGHKGALLRSGTWDLEGRRGCQNWR